MTLIRLALLCWDQSIKRSNLAKKSQISEKHHKTGSTYLKAHKDPLQELITYIIASTNRIKPS